MKHTFRFTAILLVLAALLLSACGSNTPTAIPTITLDDAGGSDNAGANGETSVSASGEVVPVVQVELSFPLTGIVKSVEVQVGDAVKAGDVLVTLDTVILDARVAEAEANAAAAQTQVRYLRRVGPADEQLNAAIAEADRANAVVEQMKAMQAQASLLSPMDGTVASVDISAGETATPGLIVVVIGDLAHMQIETTDLSERDVAFVQAGQKATVYIEALNSELQGSVTDVARIAETVGGDVVYKVTIALDQQPDGLRWGMSADVTIQVEP
jgi:HlyD family secretion protein